MTLKGSLREIILSSGFDFMERWPFKEPTIDKGYSNPFRLFYTKINPFKGISRKEGFKEPVAEKDA